MLVGKPRRDSKSNAPWLHYNGRRTHSQTIEAVHPWGLNTLGYACHTRANAGASVLGCLRSRPLRDESDGSIRAPPPRGKPNRGSCSPGACHYVQIGESRSLTGSSFNCFSHIFFFCRERIGETGHGVSRRELLHQGRRRYGPNMNGKYGHSTCPAASRQPSSQAGLLPLRATNADGTKYFPYQARLHLSLLTAIPSPQKQS